MRDEEEPDRGLYGLLHLSPEASDEEIRRAYRQWAQVYHPDKHQSPQMQGVATESFQRIREAYEILSDEKKRKIYDLYGMEGLNAGLELGPKLSQVDDLLRAFEKLRQKRREQQMSDRVRHSSSLVVDLSLAENSSNYLPVLRAMTSASEVHASISKKSTLVLGGNISFRQGMGGGTLSALFRHHISPEADLEILGMIGLRSLLTIQTSRKLSVHSTGAIGLSVSLADGTVNLTNIWTRQLSDNIRGSIELVVGPDTALAVGWEGHGEINSGFGGLKLGTSGFGVSAQFNHGFSGRSRGRIAGRVGSTGVEVEVGGERRISNHSALAMSCIIGTHGISYKLRFSRGGQKFIIPLLLTRRLNPMMAAGALLIPSSLYAILKTYVLKPYFRRRKEQRRREQRRESAAQVLEARVKAEKSQALLKTVADRNRDKQMKKGGLVIVEAIYGNLQDGGAVDSIEDDTSDDEELPLPILDVTTTLNFLVNSDRLELYAGVKKSGLMGFCDPCPGEPKQLKVIYTYHHKRFEVVVGDFDELTLPNEEHRQSP